MWRQARSGHPGTWTCGQFSMTSCEGTLPSAWRAGRTTSPLLCLHHAAELLRVFDHGEGLFGAARADHGDRAVIEQAAENILLHLHRLHPRDIDLDGAPGQKPGLDDHPRIGDGEFA